MSSCSPCHQCHVMSHHVPHNFVDYVNSILEKCYVNWKSKSHPCNLKSHVGTRKALEKSNSHDVVQESQGR